MLSVDLQRCDSAAVPLPSPCDRVVSQVASATSLIKRRLDEAAARRYMLLACVFHRRSRTYVRVHMFFFGALAVCQHLTKALEPDESTQRCLTSF